MSRMPGDATSQYNAGDRPAAVAGRFYPADPQELRAWIRRALRAKQVRAGITFDSSPAPAEVDEFPKAIIVPHAGYMYSGAVAASAYRLVKELAARVRRVVAIGPAHYVPVEGVATCSYARFLTPLGSVPVDRETCDKVLASVGVKLFDLAHAPEHCLEVQLPFLQEVFDKFVFVPLLMGATDARMVSEVLEALWGDEETLIVVSSDLSHYHDYDTAVVMDKATSEAITSLDWERVTSERACGAAAIGGLLMQGSHRGAIVRVVGLCNSGDVVTDPESRQRVVGYGSYVLS